MPARERMPVERLDVRAGGRGRAHRCPALVARERLPVGRRDDSRGGCPVTMQTCSYAVRFGHLEILQWLRAVGCPWDWRDCEIWAMASNQVDMLAWLRENKAG